MSKYRVEHRDDRWWIISNENNRQASYSSKQGAEYALDMMQLAQQQKKKRMNKLNDYVVCLDSMRVVTAESEEEAQELARQEFIEMLQRGEGILDVMEEFDV